LNRKSLQAHETLDNILLLNDSTVNSLQRAGNSSKARNQVSGSQNFPSIPPIKAENELPFSQRTSQMKSVSNGYAVFLNEDSKRVINQYQIG